MYCKIHTFGSKSFSFQIEQEGPTAEEAFDFFTKTW